MPKSLWRTDLVFFYSQPLLQTNTSVAKVRLFQTTLQSFLGICVFFQSDRDGVERSQSITSPKRERDGTGAPEELKIGISICKWLFLKWIKVNNQHRKYSVRCRVCRGGFTCHWGRDGKVPHTQEIPWVNLHLKINWNLYFQSAYIEKILVKYLNRVFLICKANSPFALHSTTRVEEPGKRKVKPDSGQSHSFRGLVQYFMASLYEYLIFSKTLQFMSELALFPFKKAGSSPGHI